MGFWAGYLANYVGSAMPSMKYLASQFRSCDATDYGSNDFFL